MTSMSVVLEHTHSPYSGWTCVVAAYIFIYKTDLPLKINFTLICLLFIDASFNSDWLKAIVKTILINKIEYISKGCVPDKIFERINTS